MPLSRALNNTTYSLSIECNPGPLKNKVESATFSTAEAFIRKTTAEAFVQAYAAVDAQVTAAVEKFEEKKAEMKAKAQAK